MTALIVEIQPGVLLVHIKAREEVEKIIQMIDLHCMMKKERVIISHRFRPRLDYETNTIIVFILLTYCFPLNVDIYYNLQNDMFLLTTRANIDLRKEEQLETFQQALKTLNGLGLKLLRRIHTKMIM